MKHKMKVKEAEKIFKGRMAKAELSSKKIEFEKDESLIIPTISWSLQDKELLARIDNHNPKAAVEMIIKGALLDNKATMSHNIRKLTLKDLDTMNEQVPGLKRDVIIGIMKKIGNTEKIKSEMELQNLLAKIRKALETPKEK